VNYEVSTGFLLLEYGFRQNILPTPQASIDVRLVLESINARDLQRGSWVNIIGYLRKPEQRQKKSTSSNTNNIQAPEIPIVQAIIVWGAGAIKVASYETALVSQRNMKQAVDAQAPL
jgi:Telomere capping, CST complex subunit